MTRKRYTQDSAADLLARVMTKFIDSDDGPHSVIEDLARADFGYVVDKSEVDSIEFWISDYESAKEVADLRATWREVLSWISTGSGRALRLDEVYVHPPRCDDRGTLGKTIKLTGRLTGILNFQLTNLLRVVGVDRLRSCRACSKTFIRRGRKEFCSETCQKRTYMRKWRKENE